MKRNLRWHIERIFEEYILKIIVNGLFISGLLALAFIIFFC